MSNLTQEEFFLKAQTEFTELVQTIEQHSKDGVRIDQAEREIYSRMLAVSHALLSGFVAGAGDGDEGPSVENGGKTLQRSEEPHRRVYRSIFGELEVQRYVYAAGPKKKIEYSPVDARLGMPRGEYSYVLEDWLERLCVKEPFAEGTRNLTALLNLKPSARSAEVLNHRMAEHAEAFRFSQEPARPPTSDEILVATADGTSVPMHVDDRTSQPTNQFGPKAGTTRRAYVGAVYSIEPFVRTADDILNELFRKQSSERRPRPEQKRVWAEMAIGPGSSPGVDRLFAELGIEVHRRDPDRERILVCLMDGERKLWGLQSQWLGRSVEILDFFHVLKRIREVGKFAESDETRRETWTERQVRDLLEGNVERVIRRWTRLSKQEGCIDEVHSALTYMRNNRDRMHYDEYLASGYPIGSGVAEGACRNLVKDRMDCTGMHWKLAGARAMLWTRAIYLNEEWDEFVEFRIQREQQQLYHNGNLQNYQTAP